MCSKGYRRVMSPVSPGSWVEIPNHWWNRWRQFATINQTIKYYKRLERGGQDD